MVGAVGLLGNLLGGNTTATVWFAVVTLIGVWLLIQHRSAARKGPGDPAQMGRRTWVRGMLGFAIVCLTFGTLAAITAGRPSGTERAFSAVIAVMLYLCAAVFIVITIRVHRRIPGDTANP